MPAVAAQAVAVQVVAAQAAAAQAVAAQAAAAQVVQASGNGLRPAAHSEGAGPSVLKQKAGFAALPGLI